MPSHAIELQNINKQFTSRRGEPPVMAVDNVSLIIEDGEFFSMLGPSGCGKTTTLRMIGGFELPTSGVIRLGDRDIHADRLEQLQSRPTRRWDAQVEALLSRLEAVRPPSWSQWPTVVWKTVHMDAWRRIRSVVIGVTQLKSGA